MCSVFAAYPLATAATIAAWRAHHDGRAAASIHSDSTDRMGAQARAAQRDHGTRPAFAEETTPDRIFLTVPANAHPSHTQRQKAAAVAPPATAPAPSPQIEARIAVGSAQPQNTLPRPPAGKDTPAPEDIDNNFMPLLR